MNFLIEDNHDVENGICLMDAFENFVGIGGIDFLDEEAMIKEYKEWKWDYTNNVTSLSKPQTIPQKIPHHRINRVRNVKLLAEEVRKEFNKELELLDISEDTYLGQFSFRGLLTRLYNTEGSLFDYQRTVKDYYKKLYKDRAKELEEDEGT